MRKPALKEWDIQKQIVDAIKAAGFSVYETTAYRQKGPSGCSKGIADVLVHVPQNPGMYFGIEVKRPGPIAWSSPEQERAHSCRHFVVAQSPEMALLELMAVCTRYALDPMWRQRLASVYKGITGGEPNA